MTTFGMIAFFLGAVLWAIMGFQYIGRHYYNFQLGHDEINIKPLGIFRLVRIRYSDIESIKIIPMWRANLFFFLPHVRFGYRLWGEGAVEIRRRVGLSKLIIITPDHPHVFIDDVQKKMLLSRQI